MLRLRNYYRPSTARKSHKVYTIVAPDAFQRRLRKFLKKHPDLRDRFAELIGDLQSDPFAPHLGYHYLGGKLKGIQAVRLTDSYRITLTIIISEQEIVLIDIGSHDEVYW